MLAGVLLACSRPGPDIGWLALVALVPLFVAWRGVGARRGAWLGFVTGATYNGIVLSWAWYFGAVAIVPFVAWVALYPAIVGAVIGALDRRGVRHPLLTAAVWVVGEGLLARWPLGGFSWGEVGYAFHDIAAMRSLGALGGLGLISFVAVAINDAIATALVERSSGRVRIGLIVPVLGLAALTIGWHAVRPTPTTTGELRYALLQGNDVNRDLTGEEFFGSPATGFENLLVYNHFELAASLEGEYDLIVFPESSFPDAPNAPDPVDFPLARWPEQLGDGARAHKSYVLANGAGDAPDGRARNLNVLWSPEGEIIGEYAKRHLVPFGEWVPWRSTIERFVDAIDQIPRDFAPGTSPGRFEIRGTPIATIICFESMFGAEVRPLVRDGAELIVVSTNNRSYRRSSNSEQHLAAAQIRAVETGRPVLQASVSGITGVVEADGRVIATQPLFENGVVSGTIATRGGMTPYVRFGDWVLWGSAAGAGLALVFVVVRRRSVDSPADE